MKNALLQCKKSDLKTINMVINSLLMQNKVVPVETPFTFL